MVKKITEKEARHLLSNQQWFEKTARKNFEDILLPYAGLPNLTFLQIGAFTGDASVWLAQNVLTHSSSVLYDIDIWDLDNKLDHYQIPMELVETIYDENIKPYPQIKKIKQRSMDFLTETDVMFDFIYIDGSHEFLDIYYDGLFGYGKLKLMGVMAFDDWDWYDVNKNMPVPSAYIRLVTQFSGTQRTIRRNTQRWIQKIEEWGKIEWKK